MKDSRAIDVDRRPYGDSMIQSRPQAPPPPWSPRNAHAASTPPPGWNPPYPSPVESPRTSQWWPYAMFGGITLLIGCLALLVVALSR